MYWTGTVLVVSHTTEQEDSWLELSVISLDIFTIPSKYYWVFVYQKILLKGAEQVFTWRKWSVGWSGG